MAVYLINILLTAFISILAINWKRQNNKNQESVYRVPLFSVVAILILWVSIYASRGSSIGTDTSGYIYFYKVLLNTNSSLIEYVASSGDFLFEALRYLICQLTNANWQMFAGIIGVITYLPILITLRREYSYCFIFSALMYIFSFHYYQGFNGMRQAAAVSITFMAYILYFRKEKYIRYAFWMIVAFGFHSTALFAIAFHFLSRLKLKSKLLWGVVAGVLCIAAVTPDIFQIAVNVLGMVGNSTLATRYSDNMFSEYSGSGYIRVLVCFIPTALCLLKYHMMKDEDEKNELDSLIIFMIFDAVLMVFSTSNWLFARLAYYVDIYIILLSPKLISAFNDNSKRLAKVLILFLYFMYMIALLLHGESNLYPFVFYTS